MSSDERSSPGSTLKGLNHQVTKSLHADIQRLLSNEPDADLAPVFERHLKGYTERRARRNACHSNLAVQGTIQISDGCVHVPIEICERQHCLKTLQTLHPTVMDYLDSLDLDGQTLCAATERPIVIQKTELAVARGRSLHSLHDAAVVQVHPDLVVKVLDGEDQTEVFALRHVQRHAQRIPTPKLLGALSFGGKTWIFLSFVTGHTLKELLATMLQEQRLSVQHQITNILTELRSLPLPSRYLGCGSPPICTDIRMSKRQSDPFVETEAEFNSFILSTPRHRISHTYLAFLRERCMDTHHKIVMTHGDLTPRNIIVECSENHVQIAAIVDWECAGAYPKHWEYVKSLNTFFSVEKDDWYMYLPRVALGRYDEEWAKNLIIDNALQ